MNAAFNPGSGAIFYLQLNQGSHEERLNKMIAAGRVKMDQEFYKGLALTILIYGLLAAASVLTTIF